MTPSDVRDQLQTTLGDAYHIERELPPGGMSRLFLATERSLDRQVVIKLLPPEYASEVSAARFQREVTLTAHLQHPHILPILSAGSRDGLLYYVMPYVEGESLRQRLEREGKLPVPVAVQILRDVADALARAHKAGVVHRDIKPENILLQEDRALLADFGVARALTEATDIQRLTDTGTGLGTPGYMAPEQLAGDRNVDARADVYALAVVGYEMLAGAAPFTGATPQAALAAHFTAVPKRLLQVRNDVPQLVSDAIARALAKEPDQRFATAAAFRDALGSAATNSRPRQLSRRWAASAAAVLLLLGVPAAWAIAHRNRGRPGALPVVVVAPFANRTGDAALDPLGDMAADWITQGLARTGLVQVVDSRTALGSAQRLGSQGTPGTAEAQAAALAKATGAEIVVGGSYYRDGDSLRVQAQLVDARTASVMRPVRPVAGPLTRKTAVLEALRSAVTGALAAVTDARVDPTTMQPPTYEAYAEFMQAVDAEMLRNDYREELGHEHRAVMLDSTYLVPSLWATWAYMVVGDYQRADSVARAVDRKRDQLSSVERAWLDWLKAISRGDHEDGLRAARAWKRLSPNSQDATFALNEEALAANRPQEAVKAWERVDLDRGYYAGNPFGYFHVARALHALGDYPAELRMATAARTRYSENPETLAYEAEAFAGLGREQDARTRMDSMSLPTYEATLSADVMREVGRELLVHGFPQAARDAFERALAMYRNHVPVPGSDRQFDIALTLADASAWNEAYPIATQLATAHPDSIDDVGLLGLLAARTGRRDQAIQAAARLSILSPAFALGRGTFWRARIALLLGDRPGAVALLRQAFTEGQSYRAVHRIEDFMPLHDYRPFQDLMRPRG